MIEPLPQEISSNIISMMFGSSPVVQAVLLLLIALSIWSWTITIAKYLQFKKAQKQSDEFRTIFWESRNFVRIDDSSKRLKGSPLSEVFSSGFKELNHVVDENQKNAVQSNSEEAIISTALGSVERALKRAELTEAHNLEKGVTFLATVASAAPFIGLFGTVWGIMNAFHGLSSAKSSTIQAVAPGISEALVATAIGLAAAIPAAVAYNYFSVTVRKFRESMETFSAEFLNVARRYVLKG